MITALSPIHHARINGNPTKLQHLTTSFLMCKGPYTAIMCEEHWDPFEAVCSECERWWPGIPLSSGSINFPSMCGEKCLANNGCKNQIGGRLMVWGSERENGKRYLRAQVIYRLTSYTPCSYVPQAGKKNFQRTSQLFLLVVGSRGLEFQRLSRRFIFGCVA